MYLLLLQPGTVKLLTGQVSDPPYNWFVFSCEAEKWWSKETWHKQVTHLCGVNQTESWGIIH